MKRTPPELASRVGVRLALMLLALGAGVAAAPGAEVSPRELVEQVGAIVRRDFYDSAELADFEAVQKRNLARRGLSEKTASAAIDEALQALHSSHTQRYTRDQIEYYELMDIFSRFGVLDDAKASFPDGKVRFAGIGIAPRTLDGRTFAALVYSGSPADRAGILAGDEIVAVDGKPFAPIASFEGKQGHEVAVQVRREERGKPLELHVPVVDVEPNRMLTDAIRSSVRVIESEGWSVGYLRVWSYASEDVESILSELLASAPLSDADALVLDLRGRWGGAPLDAAEMFVGRGADVVTLRNGEQTHAQTRWHKPLVALVDAGTRSGMEILAYSLQRASVPLIGSPTAGAVVAGRAYVLRDESLMLLAVEDVQVDGKRLEGTGVQPDVEVPFDVRYAAGRDPQLDRAVAELAKRLAN